MSTIKTISYAWPFMLIVRDEKGANGEACETCFEVEISHNDGIFFLENTTRNGEKYSPTIGETRQWRNLAGNFVNLDNMESQGQR